MSYKHEGLLWGRGYDMTNVISPYDLRGYREYRRQHGEDVNWSDYKRVIADIEEYIQGCIDAEELAS